jgi:hypothetical protein
LALAGLVVLALHLVAPVTLAPALWGARTWAGFPYPWRALWMVIGVSMLTATGVRAFESIWGIAPRTKVWIGCALAAAAACFWIFRTRVLWGNPSIAAEDAFRGRVNLKHTLAAAASALVSFVGDRTVGWPTGPAAVRVVSLASGIVGILGAFALGRALFRESPVKARVVAWTILTQGLTQQFFGTVENYAFGTAAQIWTLVWLARLARPRAEGGTDSPVAPAAAASVATGGYVVLVFLWPSILLGIFRERGRGLLAPKKLAAAAAAALVPVAIAAVCLATLGYTWRLMLVSFGGMDGTPWVPLAEGTQPKAFFTLFSWDHAAARANAATLAVPAIWGVLACLLVRRDGGAADPTLARLFPTFGLAALASLSFFFLVHPDLGPSLDWMQTSMGTLAPLVFLMMVVLGRVSDATAARLGTVWVALSALHTFPWVLANSEWMA